MLLLLAAEGGTTAEPAQGDDGMGVDASVGGAKGLSWVNCSFFLFSFFFSFFFSLFSVLAAALPSPSTVSDWAGHTVRRTDQALSCAAA